MRNKSPKYSWILPIKDEEQSVLYLFKEIKEAMAGKSYEVIAIDDGSKDKTRSVLKKLIDAFPQLIIVHFTSPKGKWAAFSAGFNLSQGEIIITSDSDLQDDPGEVKKLLDKLSQGYDLVSGWRKARLDPFYKVLISKIGNFLVSAMSKKSFKDLNAPFKVYKRQVLEELPKQGSLLRFSMLFADKLGYKMLEVPIIHRPRLFGKSKFGVVKYLRIIYDLVLIFLLFSGSGGLRRYK